MRVVSRTEIERSLDLRLAFAAVEEAFKAFSAGQIVVPPVGYLPFDDPPGDVHIKFGHRRGDEVFVIKIASGFYENPKLGMPSSNGMMLVFDATTGIPLAVLQDEGILTDIRTAIAAALVGYRARPGKGKKVGVVGAGIQAKRQIECVRFLDPESEFRVWSRREEAARKLVADLGDGFGRISVESDLPALCGWAEFIHTTTPAADPVIESGWIGPGTHITAVGADAPGKQELDVEILARADLILVDSKEQCVDHGEVRTAWEKGRIEDQVLMEFGAYLSAGEKPALTVDSITVADLTGIAPQDIAISKSVWNALRD